MILACRDPAFCDDGAAEDFVIARTNPAMLEERHGMVFANRDLVSRFSREREDAVLRTFGFHGVFNLSGVLGMDGFWDLYRSLDHRGTVRINFWPLLRAVAAGPAGLPRALQMLRDALTG